MTIFTKQITLNPGQSGEVGFTVTPATAKSYSVNVDGLNGSFNVLEVPLAEFQVSNLVINPAQVYVGETVSISVTVTNIGNISGTYEVTLEVL